ncbi:MAG: hypothetical protein V4474_02150 [Patescibacteria group bacterium]
MNTIITCRECGHQEVGRSENTLMNRIKVLNHIRREHSYLATTPSRALMLTREDHSTQEQYDRDTYNLEVSY